MAHHHGMKTLAGLQKYCRITGSGDRRSDRFDRMFPELTPSYTRPDALATVGAAGGPMDAGPAKDRTDTVAVGQIFFGQFVDHDITLDATTSFRQVIDDAGTIPNVRTPNLDLDCIYGLGPEAEPFLYVSGGDFGGARMLTGADSGTGGLADDDLARASNGRAIIGDPRNDENRVISQMQLAMIRFHNHVCETIHSEIGATGSDLFEHAREVTTWHYQWAVVNDYLTAICGAPVVHDVLACGRRHYCGEVPYIPVEFSVAAYRFGHSMIPQKVQVQKNGPAHDLFGAVLGGGFAPLVDAAAVVDFHELFFTPANRTVQRADKLDTKLASSLLALPFIPADDVNSLAVRNLLRGNAFLLPGGDKLAEHMGRPEDELDQVRDQVESMGFDRQGIPLWLYLLAEAEVIGRAEPGGNRTPGDGLGPVGARIVAETVIGLLELDEHSYLGANRNWTPRDDWDSVGKILTVAQP